ncbi:YbhB/YbcL family Raf kinase inhibitor-like protein [Methanocella sp. MCL-LM]|uniref:YbhB/YbcL family Raf kinase inhibitor-like protein n=1 Tax=Methanocella sp. MCL-LM TaxID=3412035 RepID=UPI003C72161E
MKRILAILALLIVLTATAGSGCGRQASPGDLKAEDNMATQVMALEVTSPAFKDGETIPAKYTADGDDMSPPLSWSAAENVSEYVLICDDPDAPGGIFTHWIIYNIPSGFTSLPAGVRQEEELDNGAIQTKNSMGNIGYNGPSPPPGKPHRYIFKLYALDAKLNLTPGMTKNQLLTAMKEHVIAEGSLTGIYGR